MIIGFVGKGGSGKSTLSALCARYFSGRGFHTLAIDADYNMDLAFNLGMRNIDTVPAIGSAMPSLRSHLDMVEGAHFRTVFLRPPLPSFSLSPQDAFTREYTRQISDTLRVMVAGEHTNNVLYGTHCSHSLFTPLKIYLPLLVLAENQYVVVDETAGTDAIGTGIVTGFDLACICVEPHAHSVKTGVQIAKMLEFYGTPYVFVGNKISGNTDRDFLGKHLPKSPLVFFGNSMENHDEAIEHIRQHAHRVSVPNTDRLARTQRKLERNQLFESTTQH